MEQISCSSWKKNFPILIPSNLLNFCLILHAFRALFKTSSHIPRLLKYFIFSFIYFIVLPFAFRSTHIVQIGHDIRMQLYFTQFRKPIFLNLALANFSKFFHQHLLDNLPLLVKLWCHLICKRHTWTLGSVTGPSILFHWSLCIILSWYHDVWGFVLLLWFCDMSKHCVRCFLTHPLASLLKIENLYFSK